MTWADSIARVAVAGTPPLGHTDNLSSMNTTFFLPVISIFVVVYIHSAGISTLTKVVPLGI